MLLNNDPKESDLEDDDMILNSDGYGHGQALPTAEDVSPTSPLEFNRSTNQMMAHQPQGSPPPPSNNYNQNRNPDDNAAPRQMFEGKDADDAETLASMGPYPSWNEHVPISQFEIKAVLDELTRKFGFQRSNMENIYDHLLTQLDSRSSRLNPIVALTSLHASYIGGDNSNYKKWFFAAQLDLDEDVGFSNMRLHGKAYKRNKKIAKQKNIDIKEQRRKAKEAEDEFISDKMKLEFTPEELERNIDFKIADYKWKSKMNELTAKEQIEQIGLYLLIWGEANQVRFLPECLCFIFKCALDHHNHTKTQQWESVPELTFLDDIITPIYDFLRDQAYFVDSKGRHIRKERDHKDIIGYDDVNQLFWYPEGIERIKLRSTNERLLDIPLIER
ncbi:hypothetical protein WICPIJ_001469 [Wickerhamomyces pijperi]|uniref:1,3-beta-glucan synthase component FKS1-like domain-containing protein n=1 Tax=Wickerhamomyces pijperi TaxID=599730 RepID=A0A9P8QBJ2_WICPI|nr:hypothetical protein WICPIJ_001469 [Wickerhamomyces pijperi]